MKNEKWKMENEKLPTWLVFFLSRNFSQLF